MRWVDYCLFTLAIAGMILGSAQAASAAGADGCKTYFGQNPGGGPPAWLCVASECVYVGSSCAPEAGPYGTQCGCGDGMTEVAPCVLHVTYDPVTGYNLACQDWSCPDDCPDPRMVVLPGPIMAWTCYCP